MWEISTNDKRDNFQYLKLLNRKLWWDVVPSLSKIAFITFSFNNPAQEANEKVEYILLIFYFALCFIFVCLFCLFCIFFAFSSFWVKPSTPRVRSQVAFRSIMTHFKPLWTCVPWKSEKKKYCLWMSKF